MEKRSEHPDIHVRKTAGADVAAETSLLPFKRISWSSVFAGVLVAIVIQLALSLLGIGIGLSTVDVMEEANPTAGLGTGTAIWYALSSLIALFAGGWVAGRLAQTPRLFDGVIHGLLAWSLVSLLTFYLLTTTLGSIIGGVGRLVGNTLSTVGNVAGRGIQAAAPAVGDKIQDVMQENGIDLSSIKQEARTLLQQTGKEELQPQNLEQQANQAGQAVKNTAGSAASNPQAAGENTDDLIDQLFSRGQNTASALDKDAIVNVIMARTGKSRAESEQVANNWINTYQQAKANVQQTAQQAKQTAKKVADDTAHAVSTAAILAFVSLVLGAAVAGFGARQGTVSKENARLAVP